MTPPECGCRVVLAWLNSQDFYELMQTYRHTPLSDQNGVCRAFDAVKKAIHSRITEVR